MRGVFFILPIAALVACEPAQSATLRKDGQSSIVVVATQNFRPIKPTLESLKSPITVRKQGVILGAPYYSAIM